jgi:putative transposase
MLSSSSWCWIGSKGTDAIAEHLEHGAAVVIPPKSNRKLQREYDKIIYKQRNRIAHCFSRLKHFRRFATR